MKEEATYDRLCEAVRKCFSSSRKIDFAPGESGVNDNIFLTFVWATISGDKLAPYDQKALLSLVGATELEAPDEKTAKIVGSLDGHKYELRLKCQSE